MNAKVRHIVEYEGTTTWVHEVPAGANVLHLNTFPGWAGRVVGPGQSPYWLAAADGSHCLRGPEAPVWPGRITPPETTKAPPAEADGAAKVASVKRVRRAAPRPRSGS